jgi:hypothetical protein
MIIFTKEAKKTATARFSKRRRLTMPKPLWFVGTAHAPRKRIKHYSSAALSIASAIFPFVQNLLIKNRPGGVAATGLQIAADGPRADSLVSLCYWVLGERFLHKGGGAVSYPLPVSGFPFAKDGFVP